MLLALPTELIDRIATQTQSADLVSLSVVHSRVLGIARRILYRDLTIHLSQAEGKTSPLLSILAANPTISNIISNLTVIAASSSSHLESLDFYSCLETVLSNVAACISLTLRVDASSTWILQRAQLPALRTFSSSFPLDHNTASFLSSCSSLNTFELGSTLFMPFTITLPGGKCNPELKHFCGSAQAAEIVVPGRPIESVHILSGGLTPNVMEKLRDSSARLKTLDAKLAMPVVQSLRHLAKFVPQLVCLRLSADFEFDNSDTWCEEVSAALRCLPDLRSFELCGLHWIRHGDRWTLPTFCSQPNHFEVFESIYDLQDWSGISVVGH